MGLEESLHQRRGDAQLKESSYSVGKTSTIIHVGQKIDFNRVRRPSAAARTEFLTQLLYSFTDVFVFFSDNISDDISGLKQVAYSLAQWIKQADVSPTSYFIRPNVVIAIESGTLSLQ